MPRVVDTSTRERLLAAAATLMYERGYEAVGVADLCEEAGARKGSFYHWYPSKRDLALAMLDRSWDLTRQAVFDPTFGDSTLRFAEQLRRFANRTVAGQRAGRRAAGAVMGCRFGNLAVELGTRDPQIRSRVAAIFMEMRGIVAGAVAAAVASGELDANTDPESSAEALVAHLEGLMVLAKAQDRPGVLARLAVDGPRLVQA